MRLTCTFSLSLVLLSGCPDKDPSDTDTTSGSSTTTDASATDSEGGSTSGGMVTDGSSTAGSSAAGSSTGASADDCAFLIGKTFLSDDELECGLGPDGPVPCHWSVSFTATTFDYQYSDVGESGNYTCSAGMIVAGAITGTIDAASGELVWSDVIYHPAP